MKMPPEISLTYYDDDYDLHIEVIGDEDGCEVWAERDGQEVECPPQLEMKYAQRWMADIVDMRADAADMAYQAWKERDL